MVEGSCHCGKVRIEVPRAPDSVGSCNCSLCRRTGWIGAYYPEAEVRITGATVAYTWGDRMIGIHHCPVCGCATHWLSLGEDFGKMGINARMLDGFEAAGAAVPGGCRIAGVEVEVRLLDNEG
jgi:hypothetical protein